MNILNNILTFFGFSENDEDSIKGSSQMIHDTHYQKPNIEHVPFQSKQFEIRISAPKHYEDSVNIATHLQNNRAVLVNLKYLDPSTSKRMIDFLCGTAYAMNGNMKKITDHMFLFSSRNILIEMADDISDIEKATQEYDGYRIENVADFD